MKADHASRPKNSITGWPHTGSYLSTEGRDRAGPQFDPNRPLRGFNPSPPLTWQLIEALVENLGLSWIFKAGIAQLSTFQDSTARRQK